MQELQLECITDREDKTFLEIVQSLLNLSIAELQVCKYKIKECNEKKEVCDIIYPCVILLSIIRQSRFEMILEIVFRKYM